MARPQGTLKISANIEPNAAAPLDARAVVATVADLTTASNFPYPYVGMLVAVKATGDLYVLTADTVTVADNWHKVGGGDGANNVVEGYYYDEKFYEDNLHTVEIEGEADTLYISVDTNVVYRYDGSEFVIISAEGQIIQVDTLPTADLTEVGNIYQYTGTTTADYTHGLFYECVNNSGVYDWKNIPVDKKDTVTLTQAQFDALPQAEKDNGTTYYITDSSAVQGISVMGNRFDKANIYTADERMIGSYMGKPLYQEVIDNISFSSSQVLIPFSNEYTVREIRGFVYNANGRIPIGYGTDTNDAVSVYQDSTGLQFQNGYYSTYPSGEIIVQYTKSSDGIVSIGTGNDYSTDEQVIGTWIDGKKLYQKTIHDFTMPSQSNVPIPNFLGVQVDKVIEIFGRCIDSNGFTFTFNPSFGDKVKCLYGTSNDAFVVQYVDASWAYNQKADITFVYTKVND